MNFERLSDFLCRVPAIGTRNVLANGDDGKDAWWIKFNIDIAHDLAWQTVQELGHVLNYLSANERLPTKFLPVSPPPYMNGGAADFLSWVIECRHPDFSPDVVCDWLEGRLPSPVEDLNQWHIKTDLAELDTITQAPE